MRPGAAILSQLKSAGLGFTSVEELAAKARIKVPDVLAEINELTAAGFDIENAPARGCRLLHRPDVLIAEDIESALAPGPVPWRVQVFRETASTNDIVDDAGRGGAEAGLAVFAESQTRGRGRFSRRWESRPGCGLWFSALLRPGWRASEAGRLTIVAAVAVAEAIASTAGIQTAIKWPNDVWVAGKKVAGILTELRCAANRICYAVVGIGINVSHLPEDFPPELRPTATSLAMQCERPPHRADLAAGVLDRLAEGCVAPFEDIRGRWIARCLTLGKSVELSTGNETVRGLAESINADGALMLRPAHGKLMAIHHGEVSHLEDA